ncbi:MAG: DUF3604 domain-containing protein, partial [Gammaproteobacteria bacterium]|nr:DUF3604 domain-containing protein [Gammaproteobacteria bacterium]
MHKKNQTANKSYAFWHLCLPGILAVWVWFAPTAIAEDADKKVFFGDLHLHTRYSYDAFYLTTDEGLDDAYRYAKGEAVPRGENGTRQIKTPLDFLAVTEHSEFLGALQSFTDPEHPLFDHPQLGRLLRSPETDQRMKAWINLMTAARNGESLEGYDQVALKKAVWSEIVDAADRHYAPGSFTTFAAYEWTGYIGADNLHRNVIFEDTKNLDLPFSADDSNLPEDLWSYLEKAHERGVEAIAIPHNSNVSNGRMFTAFDTQGMPIDEHYAERRHHHEPVVEITQSKGSSETHPDLSPYDPFSNFEIFSNLLIGHGQIGKIEGSYAREALLLGIDTKKARGFNPLMFGFIGSTDSHGAYSHTEEDNVTGFGGPDYDPTPESRWDRELWNGLPYYALSAGGVTGVWAEANTREQIFAAFKRRETYATSGPRIRVRAFAGWEYSPDLMDRSDWVELAYANGVPMGSVIDRQPDGEAPRLAVWAERDPKGANLDRIQIIKGSIKKGEPFIHIFNVALSDGRVVNQENQVAAVGNTVDVEHASYTNDIGAAELKAMWVDPDFDPDVPAFYYVRVIEIPTPRWSTYDAAAL